MNETKQIDHIYIVIIVIYLIPLIMQANTDREGLLMEKNLPSTIPGLRELNVSLRLTWRRQLIIKQKAYCVWEALYPIKSKYNFENVAQMVVN